MLEQLNSVFQPLRITIPLVLDIIFVDDPYRIKQSDFSLEVYQGYAIPTENHELLSK